MSKLTTKQVAELESQGCAITGDIGGIPKRRYWRPDGREILAIPAMRTYRIKGQAIEGLRDANLDKGWLVEPPKEPKPFCTHCDEWHDTQEEIDACGEKRKAFDKKWAEKTRKMNKNTGGQEVEELKEKVSGMESDISDIKNMLAQLLRKGE